MRSQEEDEVQEPGSRNKKSGNVAHGTQISADVDGVRKAQNEDKVRKSQVGYASRMLPLMPNPSFGLHERSCLDNGLSGIYRPQIQTVLQPVSR